MLVLEIAWLGGFARLARHPADPEPDWPPQPDRIFSALVASWAAGGEDASERAALEWLEALEPPLVEVKAEDACARATVTAFVPPNDIPTLAVQHKRQPRTFPTVALDPDAPFHLRLFWNGDGAEQRLPALQSLASRLSYVGHSASFVRCRFLPGDEAPKHLQPATRAPYPGRLSELEALHRRHMKGATQARPRPATRSGAPLPERESAHRGPFADRSEDWVVFAHAGGERPDLRAAAIVADLLRRALMECWTDVHAASAPPWISGHEADGRPAAEPHLAVVPMANVGWEHADGTLLGLALVPPRGVVEGFRADTPEGFEAQRGWERVIDRLLARPGRPGELELAPPGAAWRWRLRPSLGERASLKPSRYLKPSCQWASVTPVVLDRHLKQPWPLSAGEAEDSLSASLTTMGYPPAETLLVAKHAGVRGVPSAWPPGGGPPWSGWARRKSFGQRPMVHARLRFAEPVAGPLLVGAGRFVGLGLFVPLPDEKA